MDVEKGPTDSELPIRSDVEVLSDASSKNPESETIKEGIANPNSAINPIDAAVRDRLTGWKLHALTIAVCFSVFLSSLETTIVSTSLVSIVTDLEGYSQGSWMITSYLLTYTGFMIIWAKISDILGRKLCLSTAIIIFMLGSGACGAAQTITQLIVFRAFQGIGGSGTMSLSFVIIPEMVPATKYALYGSITSFTFAIAYLLGPLIGGAINDNTTWRYIFLLNVPAAFVALVLLIVAMPAGFPSSMTKNPPKKVLSKELLSRIDFLGFMVLLAACALFVVALEESGIRYAWSEALPITFLVLSGLLWIGFFAWERVVSRPGRIQEPVFTWRFVKNRVFLGVLLVDFLAGVPFFVTIIQIPQRFQLVNGTSTLESGVRMLPFILGIPISTAFTSMSASKLQVPPIFLFALGCCLQIVGAVLLSNSSVDIRPQTYGFEAILGVGLGLNIGSVIIITPNLIPDKDQSVAMGAITQFRALGGVLGLAIAANVLNNYFRTNLSAVISPEQFEDLLQTPEKIINALPDSVKLDVRTIFAEGYNLQMKIMIAFGAAQVIGLGLMWEKKLRRVW